MNTPAPLPVECRVLLSYLIDQKPTPDLARLAPSGVIDQLKRNCPLVQYLFEHPESVVMKLLASGLCLPSKSEDLDILTKELRTTSTDYLIRNLETIMKRIPLSQISVISDSAGADPNVKVLGEQL